jgi:hypothetical protein
MAFKKKKEDYTAETWKAKNISQEKLASPCIGSLLHVTILQRNLSKTHRTCHPFIPHHGLRAP